MSTVKTFFQALALILGVSIVLVAVDCCDGRHQHQHAIESAPDRFRAL
jgi:hypothetical protein